MAEEAQAQAHATRKRSKRRSLGHKKDGKAKKKLKVFQGTEGKPRIDNKMRKLFRKRARDYNSDDEDESVPSAITPVENKQQFDKEDVLESQFSDEEGDDSQDVGEEDEISEDEDGEIQPGITKFTQGCNAFRMAFKKITKKGAPEDPLGPVLSAHKKLVAEKLAEEVEDHKAKGEAKKEKHLVGEKGHVKPANFLDSHEKFLIGVATKGVVKLFNAVNKAQSAQKGLNPSRSKDAKALRKQRKEVFFSELGRTSSELAEAPAKVRRSTGPEDGEGPSWAPLRDNYMLTSSKLKDWDKMPDTTVVDDVGGMPSDDSSDDD